MEKYRKFGDAATGVNPFIFKHNATILSTVLAVVFFPFRLVLALIIALLLFVVDMGLHSARKFFIAGIVTPYLLFPLQSLLGQLFLLAIGNVTVSQRVFPRQAGPQGQLSAGVLPGPGDVIMCNMQSPLDVTVLLATGGLSALRIPYMHVAFFCHNAPHIVSVGPNPFQRWKAMFHVMYSASRRYLATAAASDVEKVTVDLTSVQRQALKLGIPVLLFGEGTTTNGHGILQLPAAKLLTPRVFVVSLRYTSPALPCIIDHIRSTIMVLFSWSALLGSNYSPTFPAAIVTFHKDTVAAAVSGVSEGDGTYVLGRSAANEIRERMASGVSYGNRNVVCVPVQLQGRNKHEFAEYYHTFGKGAAGSQ
jgi:hypothetical protein